MITHTNNEGSGAGTVVSLGHYVYTKVGAGRVIAMCAEWCIFHDGEGREVPVRWDLVLDSEPRAMYRVDNSLVDVFDKTCHLFINLNDTVFDCQRQRFGWAKAMTATWCVYLDPEDDEEHIAEWCNVWLKAAPIGVESSISKIAIRSRSVVE